MAPYELPDGDTLWVCSMCKLKKKLFWKNDEEGSTYEIICTDCQAKRFAHPLIRNKTHSHGYYKKFGFGKMGPKGDVQMEPIEEDSLAASHTVCYVYLYEKFDNHFLQVRQFYVQEPYIQEAVNRSTSEFDTFTKK